MIYAAEVITATSQSTEQLTSAIIDNVYFQCQGYTSFCGLCCLNNMYEETVFTSSKLDEMANKIWYTYRDELGINPTESIQECRSCSGDYSIDVLLNAITEKGDTCENLTLTTKQMVASQNSVLLLQQFINSQPLPFVSLFKERGYYYVCIHITSNGQYLCLDSKKKEVHKDQFNSSYFSH